jgi:peptide chain release factor subunit 1
MQTQEIDRSQVRRLVDTHTDGAPVLSVYLNLDPREFATAEARASAVTSVVDEAERRARRHKEIRPDVERLREFLESADFQGAHGMAVFASEPAGLFEAFRLPRPVPNDVVVGSAPFVEPLAELVTEGDWFVLLANRRIARFLRGSREHLDELGRLESDTPGRHDQGGWSQARYQRSIDNEAFHHLRRTAQELQRRRRPFQHLLLGAPDDAYSTLEGELSAAVRARLRGRVSIDVENTSADDVLAAARPLIERFEREHETALLERMGEGLAGGRGAAGTADVLEALSEQRVEALLVDERFSEPGVRCSRCGWLGSADGHAECPADGGTLDRLEDVSEAAIERAFQQDADVVVLRDRPELGAHGGIAAVLRF